jgi:hypothetical protein
MINREYQMKPLKKYYNKFIDLSYKNNKNNKNKKNKIPIININLGNEIVVCIDYGLEILPNLYFNIYEDNYDIIEEIKLRKN